MKRLVHRRVQIPRPSVLITRPSGPGGGARPTWGLQTGASSQAAEPPRGGLSEAGEAAAPGQERRRACCTVSLAGRLLCVAGATAGTRVRCDWPSSSPGASPSGHCSPPAPQSCPGQSGAGTRRRGSSEDPASPNTTGL